MSAFVLLNGRHCVRKYIEWPLKGQDDRLTKNCYCSRKNSPRYHFLKNRRRAAQSALTGETTPDGSVQDDQQSLHEQVSISTHARRY